ncbi:MAG: PBP1A family penicillin-binding protein [Deltaproteobacteria bacterium]|jgi:penicillin-binding protein 1A|nr:MAG: PBP1A family penicillin-binding protein [Deltaproteobacteria bacterium]
MQPNKNKSGTKRIKFQRKRNIKRIKFISIILLIPLIALILSVGGVYYYFRQDLPDISSLKNYHPNITSKFYSDEGELIGEFYLEKRIVVPITRIPRMVIDAFISAEDSDFYKHKGISPVSIIRAFFKNILAGRIVQGGSTITQQVTKYFLLSPERSLSRKIKEAILAYRVENELSKENILFLYLNQIYLGHGAYGVESAAQSYFGKHVEDLSLAEATMLAGLPRAPSKYSPFVNSKGAKERQAYVLKRMLKEGYITDKQFKQALTTPLTFNTEENKQILKAPYFTEHIRRYIEEKYGSDALYKEGLLVYTSLNLDMQNAAQVSLESGLMDLERRHKYQGYRQSSRLQGALMCMDPDTGYVRAMVGGKDFKKSEFNRAIQAKRQGGSAFKPIIYAAALDKGYTPATILVDSPISYDNLIEGEPWQPKNFDGEFRGPITFREALAKSINVVAVKILGDLGIDYVARYASMLGITSPLNMDLTMALGSSSVSLLELTRAYAVFAAQGRIVEPIFVTKVVDQNGMVLEENKPQVEEVISPQTAYIMTNLLKGVVQNGTGSKAQALGRPCAGKTGTTNDYVDAWFIGYTPEIVTGVWVGFDEGNRPLGENETGSQAALPIWIQFMKEALKNKEILDFPVPEGIVFVNIDSKTGLPATPNSTGIIPESFKEDSNEETIPTEDSEKSP